MEFTEEMTLTDVFCVVAPNLLRAGLRSTGSFHVSH